MSVLGIDVGTTGCKAGALTADGRLLGLAYREYDMLHPRPGWAEFDARHVWRQIQTVIAEVAAATHDDPIVALAVTSCGEATVPVSADRHILGPSILGHDSRGQVYADELERKIGAARLHALNGNILGPGYTACKLAWVRDHEPELFAAADKFLLWGGLVGYLLGGGATADLSTASRTLWLDLERGDWSPELAEATGMPLEKLPRIVPSGTPLGVVPDAIAAELGLPRGVQIVAGGHDQCTNALGAGVVEPGQAVYGMGTFICVTPVYDCPPPSPLMLASGLNVEPMVLPGMYASFLYNLSGGALLRWARDTFAGAEKVSEAAQGRDVYDLMMAEMPAGPTRLMVLPHFAPAGPPTFDGDSSGVILGLKLETSRGELVKGLLEGMTYYFKEGLDLISQAGLQIHEFRATGGGSKSAAWLQLTADILGQPIGRPAVNEAGVVGAALLAGATAGLFPSAAEAAKQFAVVKRFFEPDMERHVEYAERMAKYKQVYPLLKDYLHQL
jgi:xylulokinase